MFHHFVSAPVPASESPCAITCVRVDRRSVALIRHVTIARQRLGAALHRLRLVAPILLLVLAPFAAIGCECSYPPLGDRTVRAAKSVFVFQLVSAEIQPADVDVSGPEAQALKARIRIVEHLGGTTASRETMRYDTQRCCGTRLDVGHFYAAFLPSPTAEFHGHAGNLLHLGEYYQAESSEADRLKSVVSGRRTLEAAYGEFPGERQHQIPRPPPPCPREN